jgi:DNA polymerase II small subunit/DNA polymerase delta subunit B
MKQQIIQKFLKEGILLSPDALEKIDEQNTEQFLGQARDQNHMVFEPTQAISAGPVITIRELDAREAMRPQDFASHYNARFSGIRDMLLKKLENTVSVTNAKKALSSTTIGMVRERTQRGFIIEDTTGWADVISKSEDVVEDDVIGLKGVTKEGVIFAEEIVWPDIPLNHIASRPDMDIYLSGKKEGILTITPEKVHAAAKEHNLQNPAWVSIGSGRGAATVLIYKPQKKVSQKESIIWLRKRHLLPSRDQIKWAGDPFLIDPVPNILWIVQPGDAWKEMYKGVIIISSDASAPVHVNLAKE